MHKHQLVKALQSGRVHNFTGDARTTALKALEDSEHFLFTSIPDVDDPEVQATIKAMQECGVWRLPYPHCTFEYLAPIKVRGHPDVTSIERFILLTQDTPPFITEIFIEARKHVWIVIPRKTDANTYEQSETDIVPGILVALRTKGVPRERWCGNKLADPTRSEPRGITYTKVLVYEMLTRGHASPGSVMPGTGTGVGTPLDHARRRVRLHLRRGHVRRQSFGAGRSQTKMIFIEPTLVGYADDGEVRHDEYVVR